MSLPFQNAPADNAQPLVSIVIPAYNNVPIIEETLASILNQTYTNWELVVLDDASPDNTYELLQEYAKRDARIQVDRITRDKSVKTHCEVRIQAIARTKGEFIAFMDGDDLFEPDALEVMVRYLQQNPEARCVYGLFREIDMQGRLIDSSEERHWNDLPANHNTLHYSELHTWDNIILQRIPMMLQLNLVRREFLEAAGGLNPYVIWDDYYFFVRMCCADLKAVHRINHYVFRYRYNHGGMSKSTAMFRRLLKNVRVTVDGLTQELKVQEIDPKYSPSFLSAKMYADIAWLRLRSGLRAQTVEVAWYAFRDTNVTFKDWYRSCFGLMMKAIVPETVWNVLQSLKRSVGPASQPILE